MIDRATDIFFLLRNAQHFLKVRSNLKKAKKWILDSYKSTQNKKIINIAVLDESISSKIVTSWITEKSTTNQL